MNSKKPNRARYWGCTVLTIEGHGIGRHGIEGRGCTVLRGHGIWGTILGGGHGIERDRYWGHDIGGGGGHGIEGARYCGARY